MKRVDELVKLQSCDACGSQAFGVVDNSTKELKKVVCLKCGATFESNTTKTEPKKEEAKPIETEKAIEVDQDIEKNKKKGFAERMKEVRGTFV